MAANYILAEGLDLEAIAELHASSPLRLVLPDGGVLNANGSGEALVDLLLKEARVAFFVRASLERGEDSGLLQDVLRDAERKASA